MMMMMMMMIGSSVRAPDRSIARNLCKSFATLMAPPTTPTPPHLRRRAHNKRADRPRMRERPRTGELVAPPSARRHLHSARGPTRPRANLLQRFASVVGGRAPISSPLAAAKPLCKAGAGALGSPVAICERAPSCSRRKVATRATLAASRLSPLVGIRRRRSRENCSRPPESNFRSFARRPEADFGAEMARTRENQSRAPSRVAAKRLAPQQSCWRTKAAAGAHSSTRGFGALSL